MIARTFLITGATKGIGRALSERLARTGHRVIGLAREDVDFPGELVRVDLANREATESALQDLTRRHSIDGVVNNVGLVRPQNIGNVSLDDLNDVLTLNLQPAVQTAQALLPGMRERRWGRVVNISSLTVLGVAQRTAYAAAKAALVSFARSWNWLIVASLSMQWRRGRPKPNCSEPTTRREVRASGATSPQYQ